MDDKYINELVEEAKLGKTNAFKELSEINLKKIYNLAYRMLLNPEDTMKVTSETFFEAWHNLKFLRTDQKFDKWLKSIAIYKILECPAIMSFSLWNLPSGIATSSAVS